MLSKNLGVRRDGSLGRYHSQDEGYLHDDHQTDDTAHTMQGSDQGNQDATDDRVDGEEQRGADKGEKGGTEESTDGEQDQSVREELGGLGVRQSSVLMGVVDEEGTDGDLGADVHELGDESERRSCPPESAVHNLAFRGIGKGFSFGLKRSFRNLGKRGKDEGSGNGHTEQGNGKVNVLNGGQVVRVFTGEEVLQRRKKLEGGTVSLRTELTLEAIKGPVKEATPLKDWENCRRKLATSMGGMTET
jgi:hypothetical protein